MAQAVTSEVVPSHALSKGLSLMNITGAASNILCFAAAGVLFDVLGLASVYLITALIALAVLPPLKQWSAPPAPSACSIEPNADPARQ
jgi:predicted MFS family arabinose efflux permease